LEWSARAGVMSNCSCTVRSKMGRQLHMSSDSNSSHGLQGNSSRPIMSPWVHDSNSRHVIKTGFWLCQWKIRMEEYKAMAMFPCVHDSNSLTQYGQRWIKVSTKFMKFCWVPKYNYIKTYKLYLVKFKWKSDLFDLL
jgi:hypothetical protein